MTRALQAMIYPPACGHLDISGHGLTGTSEDKRTKLGCPSSAGAGQSGRFMTWYGRSCVWGLKTSSPKNSHGIYHEFIMGYHRLPHQFYTFSGYQWISENHLQSWETLGYLFSEFLHVSKHHIPVEWVVPHLGPSDDLGCLDHAEAEFAQVLALQRRQVGGSLLGGIRWVR